ncbi:MAG: DUF3857 domain-containing protein [Planctomycetes bacterium]|nr:DUF3857 domain-containing protein [Planctomycetota bacterium]
MHPRSPGRFSGPVLFSLLALLAFVVPARAQDLLPREREALRLHAAGDYRTAAKTLLQQAGEVAASADGTADDCARVEAWAALAAEWIEGEGHDAGMQALGALQQSPLARRNPLLADRLAVAELHARAGHPSLHGSTLPQQLGLLRTFWLIGPFANERGAGYREPLPPERGFDLAAELPGKRRTVRWRQLPELAAAGVLSLDTVVHPREQTLAYLATALVAAADTDAVLEFGSTGSVRVFCNGAEVFARDVERPLAYDQDAVVLPLQKGRNLLLLKVCHQEGAQFAFTGRVRWLSPTAAITVAGSRDDLLAAAQTKPVERAADAKVPTVDLGARSHWPIDTTRGADALRLAWVWTVRSADGDRDRRDQLAASAAVRELPDVPMAHLLLARTLQRHGRSAADQDDNDRRRALEQALQLDPQHVVAHVHLGELLLAGSRMWPAAQQHADAALQVAKDHPGALLLRARALSAGRSNRLAEIELAAAAQRPSAGAAVRAAATRRLRDDDPRAATALWRSLAAHSTDPDVIAGTAAQEARTGDYDGALQRLRTALQQDPLAVGVRRQLVRLLRARDQHRQALALLEPWLQIAPDDVDALAEAAACWRQLADQDPDAKERQLALLRELLQIEPNRRDDERYVEFLAAALRPGDDGAAFQKPFQLDAAALVAKDPGPPEDAKTANDPLHWLLRQTVVRANGNGTTNTYHHWIVRVLTPDGAGMLTTFHVPAYQGEQRARMLACTVFRRDGTVQRPPLQGASVRLPDLQPGDTVSLEGRVDDVAPTFFGDYFGLVHTFGSPEGSPVRSEELVVLAAKGRDYRLQELHGAPAAEATVLADGTQQWRWQMRELPRDKPEPRRPQKREFEPLVRITTYRDWDHFAAWWWNLIKPQLEVTPAMRQTVAKLCDGLDDPEAKVRAIYHFVTTDVRYEAWEFGVHGYKPYATSIIHDRRHGDCKDKALLLCALLGEIGVPCRPVLIFADPMRTNDDLALPMVQHFNHCIAWLPPHEGRPGRFLDGTATWHPTDTLPDMDQGAAVLVVDAGKAELRPVPWTTPTANLAAEEFTIELGADGKASLRHRQQPRGNAAVELRAMLATEPARRREVVERSLTETIGKVTLRDLQTGAGTGPEDPVELTVDATLDELGQRTATSWQLPSTFADTPLLGLTAEAERHAPLLLGVPIGESTKVRYVLPPSWRAGELPPAVTQQAPFGSFTMRWHLDGSAIVVERELQLARARIEPREHAAFRDFVAAIKTADSQLVLLQKEAGR